MLLVDLFCGIGGFSTGAKKAGYTVALALDHNPDVGKVYIKLVSPNFQQYSLGGDLADAEKLIKNAVLRAGGGAYHVAASPPCKLLSKANTIHRGNGNVHAASNLELTKWTLQLLARLRPHSFSIEQVVSPQIIALYTEHNVPHAIIDCSDIGVPQTRKRIIAGLPGPISRLSKMSMRKVTPREALKRFGITPSDEYLISLGTDNVALKSGGRVYGHRPARPGEFSRSLDETAYTVTTKPLKWVKRTSSGMKRAGVLDSHAMAALQCFPVSYKRARDLVGETKARRYIGDCVPPPLSHAMLKN